MAVTAGAPSLGESVSVLVFTEALTGEPSGPSPLLTRRLACHILLGQLPSSGLAEALDALKGMVAYYRLDENVAQIVTASPSTPVRSGQSYDVPAIVMADL